MRPFHPPARPHPSFPDRLRRVALLAATGLVLGACESSLDVQGTISRVEVTAETTTIAVGETTVLSATAFNNDAEPLSLSSFRWSTDGGNLSVIGGNRAELQGTAPGAVTVTATIVGLEDSVTIDVVAGGADG